MERATSVDQLRPRFLPDKEAHLEWGSRGAALVRATKKGFRVPPVAAWGVSEIRAWLGHFPEFPAALSKWRNWDKPAPALKLLQEAILNAPMPAHWPLSLKSIQEILGGGKESWPLILRPSFRRFKSREPAELASRNVAPVTAENLWREFVGLVAEVFSIKKARESLVTGFDPQDLKFAILVQPKLNAVHKGTWYSEEKSSPDPMPSLEHAPFWKSLLAQGKSVRNSFKRAIEMDWLWDGEELWVTDIRPQLPSELRQDQAFQTLLVDLDGTLLGAREIPLRMSFISKFISALKPHGGWIKATKALLTLQSELKTPSPDMMNDERATRKFSEVMGWPVAQGREWLRSSIGILFPKLEHHFYPVPGAKEFLEWAKSHYPMYLATNPVWEEDIIKLRLKWAGIDPSLFKSITHSSRMRACKPEPQYYSDLLSQEGLKAEECLLIGDDLRNDLPATRVGIRVFILSKKDEFHALNSYKEGVPAWQGGYLRLRALMEAMGEVIEFV